MRRGPPSAPGAEWHVYDPDGRLSGTILLPGRLRPSEITATHILGVERDELDVEYIVKYRYGPAPSG